MAKSVFRPTLVTDFANAIPDYADLILKPDYAVMTCPKPDNAHHHYGPINLKYTPLRLGVQVGALVLVQSVHFSKLGRFASNPTIVSIYSRGDRGNENLQ